MKHKEDNNLSHNVYYENSENNSNKLPTYLIFNGNQIFQASCITDAIKMCAAENKLCSVFEKVGCNGKYWQHLIDCSKDI